MAVFISHSSKDDAYADALSEWLTERHVRNVNDGFDVDFDSPEDITKTILRKITICTHLIVVFTGNTQDSWWVPFEIGAGSHKNSFLSTWHINGSSIPEYLDNWPIYTTDDHLEEFVRQYKKSRLRMKASKTILEKSETARRDLAADFHTHMRRFTGQIG